MEKLFDLPTFEDIHKVGLSLNSIGKVNVVLQTLAREARAFFDAELVVIYEYSEDKKTFTGIPIISGKVNQPHLLAIECDDNDLVFHIVEIGNHFSSDVKNDPDMLFRYLSQDLDVSKSFAFREEIASAAAIRLELQGEIAGVMFLNYKAPRTFSEDDKRLMALLSDYAALAYLNAKERESLTGNLTFLTSEIFDIQKYDTLSESPLVQEKEILEDTLHAILKFQNETLGYYADYDDKQDVIRVAITSEIYSNLKGNSWSADRGITGKAVRKKEAEKYRDVIDVPEYIRFSAGDVKDIESKVDINVKSAIVVPFIVTDQVEGVFLIESETYNNFSDIDLRIAEMLVNQTQNAIKILRYVRTIELGRKKLSGLRELDNLISTTWDFDKVLDRILDIANRFTKGRVARSNISLIERDEHEFFLVHYINLSPEEGFAVSLGRADNKDINFAVHGSINKEKMEVKRPKKRKGVTRQAALLNESLNLTDTDAVWDELYYPVIPGIRSELAVPMRVNDVPIGVINMESTDPTAFDEEDQELIETLAGQAVIAILMQKVFEDIKIISLASLRVKKDEFGDLILSKATELFGVNTGTIWYYNEEKAELEFGRYFGSDKDLWKDMYLDPRYSLIAKVFTRGETKLTQVEDYLDDKIISNRDNFKTLYDAGIRSIISAPFIADGEKLGVMNLYSKKPLIVEDWQQSWINNRLELFSAQISIALQNFKSVHVSIFERLRELVNIATHEIYGYVGSIKADLDELDEREEQFDLFTKTLLGSIRTASNMALEVPGKLSGLLDKIHTRKQQVYIYVIIDQIVSELKAEGVKIIYDDLKDDPPVYGNHNALKEGVFAELINNAIKALPQDGGEIFIRSHRVEHFLRTEIEDTGHGILLEEAHRVFEHSETQWPPGRVGTGMGLYYAKKIVELDHQGRLSVCYTERGRGTIFCVDLPVFVENPA